MVVSGDSTEIDKVISLMDYLAKVTDAAERDPVRDILSGDTGAPDPVIWLDELPQDIRRTARPAEDVLLRVRPPRSRPEPARPDDLAGWIDPAEPVGLAGPEPALVDLGPASMDPADRAAPPNSIVRAFTAWKSSWQAWAGEQRRTEQRRQLYTDLEHVAKRMEQQDDVYEFVLGVGLVRWAGQDGNPIQRHLVSEPVVVKLDRATAEVVVALGGGKRRVEDKELFGAEQSYQPERGRAARQEILDSDITLLDPKLMPLMQEWLGIGLTDPFEVAADRTAGVELPTTPTLSPSPALLLRPRSRVLLAEAYKRIAAELRTPRARMPVALAQLVLDTDRGQRDTWLSEQGAASGDVLGVDPLFPLPANDEQLRVIELLRTETGVVVQGPPGTGKTHTIANLVSALLARGQRVLVTSQKDQALKVLREKIPPELRQLCVLLAGGSKDAAKELEQGLSALSAAIASPDTAALPRRITELRAERDQLRSQAVTLNEQIRAMRDVENVRHEPVAPGYGGTLTEIVREVKHNAKKCDWVPPVDPGQPDRPPLGGADLAELLKLTRADTAAMRLRGNQTIPEAAELPNGATLAEIMAAERQARDTAHQDSSELTQRLAGLGEQRLRELLVLRDQARSVLQRLGFGVDGASNGVPDWLDRAVADRLAGRHAGLWGDLLGVRGEAAQLQDRLRAQGVRFVVEYPPLAALGLGRASGLLNAGRQLRDYRQSGGKIRRVLPTAAQKEAAELLELVRVDGRPPTEIDQLDAVIELLTAEVAAAQLVVKWANVAVRVNTSTLTVTLSELSDNADRLAAVEQLVAVHGQVGGLLARAGLPLDLSDRAGFLAALDAVPAALHYVELRRARNQVNELADTIRQRANDPNACPELGLLLTAVAERDLDGYGRGLTAVETARMERDREHRRAQLARTLRAAHPRLIDLIEASADDAAWDNRLADLPEAWAWSKAEQFVRQQRNSDEERALVIRFDEVEDQIGRVTEGLAAAEAMHLCVERMSDAHAMALRTYREHMSHIGAGTGSKVQQFRKAARAAMRKAKDAVPAWVVPLPNLLDNIAAERDSFDVVIVDEASQVGLENLFLLWMAPRVIVVGDEKQCTPGGSKMGTLDEMFDNIGEFLDGLDEEIRHNFTAKSNLYGLLSARSGKNAVVRLREHFRCMPEIINWSSSQFYGEHDRPGLVPLRERKGTDLEPLKVVRVTGAYTEGRNANRRNPVEADAIVAQLVRCLADPQYAGKTFGVVVLQSSSQHIRLLDLKIMAATTPEQREERKIRVGNAPNFQGDERDVIFLSMVVAEPPHAQQAEQARQSFNVAASRARDQMWLFTSVAPADLKPHDLRTSLLGYMLNPPSVYGESPDLNAVSDTQRCDPFDSLFEQRVYRQIKKRGYYVVPQFRVGTRSLDMVIVGDGGRLAVECDGHHWHTSPSQEISDARRDRELRRMRWDVVRVRESEFEFNVDRELARLWDRLVEREIHPREAVAGQPTAWAPIDLPDDDGADDDDDSAEVA